MRLRGSKIRTAIISMRHAMLFLSLVGWLLLACSGVVLAQVATPPLPQVSEGAIPDHYIVVLKDGVGQAPEQVANEHAREHGLGVRHVYQNAIRGYSAMIPNERVATVGGDSRVAYIEPDKEVNTTGRKHRHRQTQQILPWGIDKIDADKSSTTAGDHTGVISNVNAYIIDTGVDTSQPDLNAPNIVNFVGDGVNTDCNGHGTHVAGTVAAKDNSQAVVGVAPGAPLTGVKVLGCDGSGTMSDVIAGVDWVTANAKKPAIANMSLGGGTSQALDTAVATSANRGIFYSVAAGNDGADACNSSPARAGRYNGVMTTAATDTYDKETSWSNYGKCVDVWAPGANILSTKKGGGTTTMSGTSMATPHVGGTGALYLSKNTGASAAMVENQLKAAAVSTGTKSKDGTAIKRLYAASY